MMCGKINEDDFYTLHHEMGHIYYYLTYQHQPYLFRVSCVFQLKNIHHMVLFVYATYTILVI